jgi:DnaJ-class molecular chaperone
MQKSADTCQTCYGAGEVVTGGAPEVCPDCFGEGKALSHVTKVEWRIRAIEEAHRKVKDESAADVLWLVNELRVAREALVRILARCQDADEGDIVASEVKFQANEALGIYDPS